MEIVFTFDCNDPRELFKIKVIARAENQVKRGFKNPWIAFKTRWIFNLTGKSIAHLPRKIVYNHSFQFLLGIYSRKAPKKLKSMLLDFFLVCLGGGAGGVREEWVGVKPVVSSQCDNGELSVVKKKKKKRKEKTASFRMTQTKWCWSGWLGKAYCLWKGRKKIHFKKHPMTRSQVFLTMAYYQV